MILKILLQTVIEKHTITADQVLILEGIYQKEYSFLEEFLKIEKQRSLLLQNLLRRGYLGLYEEDIGYEILYNLYVTDKGEEVITTLKEEFENFKKLEVDFKPTSFEEKFQEFWDLFPSSDKYMHFPRSRVLKTELDKCKKMYRKLLEDYKHENIMKALNYEINMREHNSASGLNKQFSDFKFMKASSTWLNNKEFLALEEIMKDDNIEKVDIFSTDV